MKEFSTQEVLDMMTEDPKYSLYRAIMKAPDSTLRQDSDLFPKIRDFMKNCIIGFEEKVNDPNDVETIEAIILGEINNIFGGDKGKITVDYNMRGFVCNLVPGAYNRKVSEDAYLAALLRHNLVFLREELNNKIKKWDESRKSSTT